MNCVVHKIASDLTNEIAARLTDKIDPRIKFLGIRSVERDVSSQIWFLVAVKLEWWNDFFWRIRL